MKDYSKMSDFEINQAVTCELHGCHEWSVNRLGNFYHCGFDGSQYIEVTVADYCNNPSDAWPIALENCIAITPCMGNAHGDATGYFEHKNPITIEFKSNDKALRSAMIVYLMMKDEGK